MTAAAAAAALRREADPRRAAASLRYMRARPGEYAAGDQFHGVPVPAIRRIAKEFKDLPLPALAELLASPLHEERLLALVILVRRYQRAKSDPERESLAAFYLDNLAGVNHWDLVDTSAPHVLGAHLLARDRRILYDLAASPRLWDRRVGILATHALVRAGDLDDAFALSDRLLADPHDLIHKAVGWTLREAGKRDEARLRAFLDARFARMPRTMLRYAVEKLPAADQRRYLDMHAARPRGAPGP